MPSLDLLQRFLIRHIFLGCVHLCVCVCDWCCFQLLLTIKYALFSVLFIHFGIFLREEKEKCPVSASCLKHSRLVFKARNIYDWIHEIHWIQHEKFPT